MMLTDLQQATASLADRAWPEDAGDPNLATRLLTLLRAKSVVAVLEALASALQGKEVDTRG